LKEDAKALDSISAGSNADVWNERKSKVIKSLWSDSGIQQCYARRGERMVFFSFAFFYDFDRRIPAQ